VSYWGVPKPADLKSAGHAAVQMLYKVAGVLKNTPKRSATILITQQHTQNWVDSYRQVSGSSPLVGSILSSSVYADSTRSLVSGAFLFAP
jgi:hypothetical protein